MPHASSAAAPLHAIETGLLRLKWLAAAARFQLASRQHELALKAGFDPNQPRVPAGNPDGGQWTDEDWDSADREFDNGATTDFSGVARRPPGIGDNQGPPLEEPPAIPSREPLARSETNDFLKVAARWLAKAIRLGGPSGAFIGALEAMSWLDTDRAFIESYQDSAKRLEELNEAAKSKKWGYNIHHIVEQDAAHKAGYPKSMINGYDNLARIPAIKHWEITGWFMQKNKQYGGLSPREWLADKDWATRRKVGLEALKIFGVLKP